MTSLYHYKVCRQKANKVGVSLMVAALVYHKSSHGAVYTMPLLAGCTISLFFHSDGCILHLCCFNPNRHTDGAKLSKVFYPSSFFFIFLSYHISAVLDTCTCFCSHHTSYMSFLQHIVGKKWEPGNLVPSRFSGQIRKVEARLEKFAKFRKVETN